MSESTKEYVVVFDLLGVETGEFQPAAPGTNPLAVVEYHQRADKVSLTDAQAKRPLEDGAIILASDRRSKLVEKNPERSTGVRRDLESGLSGAVPLEEHAPAKADGGGAKRAVGGGKGKLGTKAELERMSVVALKQLAAEHGVEVERTDNKKKLAAKLAKVVTAPASEDNPGLGEDESPPPENQPDAPPE